MENIFELATSIPTPLALGGFYAAIVFFLFRQIVAENFFPKLTAAVGAKVLILIIERIFVLSLVAIVLGFAAYFFSKPEPQPFGERPKLELLARELESQSMVRRLVAVSQFGKIAPETESETENIVRVLEVFINRRAALGNAPSNDRPNQDIAKAFRVLSAILKSANAKSFNIFPPEFQKIDLSSIDLSNMYLRRARFLNSIFDDAVLDGSDLSEALLMDIQFNRVQARNVVLASARIQQSCAEESIFDHANLSAIEVSSSDFNGASFRNSNLSAARFENTRFSFATLNGANLTRSDLSTALELTTQQLQEVKFIGTAKVPSPLYIKSRLSICKVK